MKNNNIYSALRKITCLLLCLFLTLAMLALASCSSSEIAEVEATEDSKESDVEYALAVRAIDDIMIGDTLAEDRLEIVRVRTDALPATAYSSISDLDGIYAISQISAGDFVTAEKTSAIKPEITFEDDKGIADMPEQIDPYELGYIVITKYLALVEGEDYAPAIRRAIEENPGRTIYFPDGRYTIKSPIVIPADPALSVSLRLSNQAVITAAEWGDDKTVAMIQIGCAQENEPQTASAPSMNELDFYSERGISIIGGCLYGSKQASGISIGGGKDTYIYNVSIKGVYNGIHIERADNELGATYVDVDNVNISGMAAPESSGILVEGTYNNFSNMRIASVNYGVLCTETGSNNVFRRIHPLVVGLNDKYTVGFWDKSDGNIFDVCYSDQFSAGFRVDEKTRAVINGSFSYWYMSGYSYHVGYESTGKFNSIIVSGKVLNRYAVAIEAYLYIGEEGGQGVVLYPVNSVSSRGFIHMLEQHCRTPY